MLSAMVFTGLLTWCGAAPLAAAQPGTTKTPQRAPADMAAEFIRMAEGGTAPWQFYSHYSAVFRHLSNQVLRAGGGSAAVVERRKQLARHYHALSLLIQEMGAQAKVRQDIIDNNQAGMSAAERQEMFVAAGRRHDELLGNLKKVTGSAASRPLRRSGS